MKCNRTIWSAVLSIALLGLTLTGTLAVSGCADPEKERQQAVAARAELTAAADAAEAAAADELEPQLAALHDQAAKAEAAMAAAEVGSPDWQRAREAARLVAIDLAGVEAAIANARKAVDAARGQADRIGKLIAEGDQIMAQQGEEQAGQALGTVASIFLPWGGWGATFGAIGLLMKKNRAAKVYRGERDLFKQAAGVVVQSIEAAKVLVPGFGDKFKEAAAVIDLKQREAGAAIKAVVDAAQGKA